MSTSAGRKFPPLFPISSPWLLGLNSQWISDTRLGFGLKSNLRCILEQLPPLSSAVHYWTGKPTIPGYLGIHWNLHGEHLHSLNPLFVQFQCHHDNWFSTFIFLCWWGVFHGTWQLLPGGAGSQGLWHGRASKRLNASGPSSTHGRGPRRIILEGQDGIAR